jgi:hypothetical protein
MDLPRELRDVVYHEAWKLTPVIVASANGLKLSHWSKDSHTYLRVTYPHDQARCVPLGLPQWLRTSKSMLNEGMVQLRREAVWRFTETNAIDMDESAAGSSPLLYPCVGRALELGLLIQLLPVMAADGTLTRSFSQSYYKDELSMFKHIVTDTAGQEAPTDIKIHLGLSAYWLGEADVDIPESMKCSFDLKNLRALGNGFPSLRTLRIHVRYHDNFLYQLEDLRQPIMLGFEEEVERTARFVLGDGCTWTQEQSTRSLSTGHVEYEFQRA